MFPRIQNYRTNISHQEQAIDAADREAIDAVGKNSRILINQDAERTIKKYLTDVAKKTTPKEKWELAIETLGQAIIDVESSIEASVVLNILKVPLMTICKGMTNLGNIQDKLFEAYDTLVTCQKCEAMTANNKSERLKTISTKIVEFLTEIAETQEIKSKIISSHKNILKITLEQIKQYNNKPTSSYNNFKKRTIYSQASGLFGSSQLRTKTGKGGSVQRNFKRTKVSHNKDNFQASQRKNTENSSIKVDKNTFVCEPVLEPYRIGFPNRDEAKIEADLVFIIPTRGKNKLSRSSGDLDLVKQIQSIQSAIEEASKNLINKKPKAIVYFGLNTFFSAERSNFGIKQDRVNYLKNLLSDFELESSKILITDLMIEVYPFVWKKNSDIGSDFKYRKNSQLVVPYGTIRNAVTKAALSAIKNYEEEGLATVSGNSKLIFLDGDIEITGSAITHAINLQDNQFSCLPFVPQSSSASLRSGNASYNSTKGRSLNTLTEKNTRIAFDIHWNLANQMYFDIPGDEENSPKVSLCYPAEPCLVVGSNWIEKIKNDTQEGNTYESLNLFGYYKQEGLNAKNHLESKGFYFGQSIYTFTDGNVSSPHVMLTNVQRFNISSLNRHDPVSNFRSIASDHPQNLLNIRNFSSALGASLGVNKNTIMKLSYYFWAPNIICEGFFSLAKIEEAKIYISSLSMILNNNLNIEINTLEDKPTIKELVNTLKEVKIKEEKNDDKPSDENDINLNSSAYDSVIDVNNKIRTEIINNLTRWSKKTIDLIQTHASNLLKIEFTNNRTYQFSEDEIEKILLKMDSLRTQNSTENGQNAIPEFTQDSWRKNKFATIDGLFNNPKSHLLKSHVGEIVDLTHLEDDEDFIPTTSDFTDNYLNLSTFLSDSPTDAKLPSRTDLSNNEDIYSENLPNSFERTKSIPQASKTVDPTHLKNDEYFLPTTRDFIDEPWNLSYFLSDLYTDAELPSRTDLSNNEDIYPKNLPNSFELPKPTAQASAKVDSTHLEDDEISAQFIQEFANSEFDMHPLLSDLPIDDDFDFTFFGTDDEHTLNDKKSSRISQLNPEDNHVEILPIFSALFQEAENNQPEPIAQDIEPPTIKNPTNNLLDLINNKKTPNRKAIALQNVNSNPSLLAHLSDDLKNDQEVARAAVLKSPLFFKHVGNQLKENPTFLLQLVKEKYSVFKYIPPEYKELKEFAVAAIKGGTSLLLIPDSVKEKYPGLILLAVQEDPRNFKYAYGFKSNETVIKAALEGCVSAYDDVPEEYKRNPNFVNYALGLARNQINASSALFRIPKTLRNIEIVLSAVEKDGLQLQFAGDFSKDRRVVIAALRQNIKAFDYVDEQLKMDPQILILMQEKNQVVM